RLSDDPAPEEVPFIRSDQFSFIRQGIPSLVIESGTQARNKGVDVAALKREYYNTHYHQPSDDLLLPLDYTAAADLARVNLSRAIDVADSDERPQWKKGDFFAKQFSSPKPVPAKQAPAGNGGGGRK